MGISVKSALTNIRMKITEVVDQRMELEADTIRGEGTAQRSRPLIALLPSLIHCSAVPAGFRKQRRAPPAASDW